MEEVFQLNTPSLGIEYLLVDFQEHPLPIANLSGFLINLNFLF